MGLETECVFIWRAGNVNGGRGGVGVGVREGGELAWFGG